MKNLNTVLSQTQRGADYRSLANNYRSLKINTEWGADCRLVEYSLHKLK